MSQEELSPAEELFKVFGFDPTTVSKTVERVGVIGRGPRCGYLCVFTKDVSVDIHATCKPNFVDADRNYNPYNENPLWLVYIFAPLPAFRNYRWAA